ncbi:MAG: ABC transporter permease [Oscillospiraceae bacterium]|nr:ABC transporter permease [Oscillospiraceae bacterium]
MTVTMVLDHLLIVVLAVLCTIVVGVPVGICAYCFPLVRKPILWAVEVLQTIPVLALLGIIMVFLGGGKPTVILGLLLYSLLPVVLNTYVGLSEVDPVLKEVSTGMGMTRRNRLLLVELPLAFPLIFTGIRIATVTAIGVAVFAASVGGGGLGGIITRGIKTGDMPQIIGGTLVLMAMAVGFDMGMAWIERRMKEQRMKRSTPEQKKGMEEV